MPDLASLLELEVLDRDLFRASNEPDATKRRSLYGGQVAGQALRAAGMTVPAERMPHSLHGYFLRPGLIDRPVILHVDRDRDGGSFSARHVIAVQDGEVGGVSIPAGAMVGVNLGSANHDPSRWTDPHSFNPHRERHAHVSFATGPHTCLGLQLARLETRIAIERLLARLPDISLDTSGGDVVVRGRRFRSPPALPVRCHAG